ncbi:MAG: hypothetical protein HGA35_01335 [Erysipelotrichaceae bacterium]|nr:hypothetical protein [Erysipelotrichaceae bacterium]
MEIVIRYKDKAMVTFSRDIFLNKFEEYFKGDFGQVIEAFNMIEKDIKKELLKL